MECFSQAFIGAIRGILSNDIPIVAPVAGRGGGFIAEVKSREDIDIIEVTAVNRNNLAEKIALRLALSQGKK